jgi:hypothetical protein
MAQCLLDFSGFTRTLKKLKLQGPSLTHAPSKSLGGALAMSWKCLEILQLIYESNLIEFFTYLTTILNST